MKSERPTISVIIITKNEERNIVRCLRSVFSWVDEIIVLDSGSTDQTVELCRQYTTQIHIVDWPGYGPQKNRALLLARHDWVLSLDADEWVQPALRAEIEKNIQHTRFSGFYIPRLTLFCGRFQRYGDAARDRVLRLFRLGSAKFSDDTVHERVLCSGEIGYLHQALLHNSYRTHSEWASQMDHYARMSAQLRHAKGQRSNPLKALLSGGWIFLRSYILRKGYLDGRLGWIFAWLNAKSSFQKNWWLWQLRHKKLK